MITINVIKSLKLTFIGLFLAFFVFACYKVENTTAVITVIDVNKAIVQGAEVHVFPNPSVIDTNKTSNSELESTKITDTQGQVFLDYTSYYEDGQVGLFVLDVEVTYQNLDTLVVVATNLKVDEQKDNQKTIELPIVR